MGQVCVDHVCCHTKRPSQARILRHVSQCHPRGAGNQTSNLLITSPPALPTELQPLWSYRVYQCNVSTECRWWRKEDEQNNMQTLQHNEEMRETPHRQSWRNISNTCCPLWPHPPVMSQHPGAHLHIAAARWEVHPLEVSRDETDRDVKLLYVHLSAGARWDLNIKGTVHLTLWPQSPPAPCWRRFRCLLSSRSWEKQLCV